MTHAVASSHAHRELLTGLREEWAGEIGAHLHPWNTPPLVPQPFPEPVSSNRIPRDLLQAKLDTLLEIIGEMGVNPCSFRMGRFNLGARMLSVLCEKAIRVDSSVAPGREYPGGPDHLIAPSDPYFPDPANISIPGEAGILEVPITIVPLVRNAGAFLQALVRRFSVSGNRLSTTLQRLLFLPTQPAWTGLRRLKAAVRLHRQRGGEAVTIFFHSSELMPGGYPRHKTEGDVSRFFVRLERFLSWLRNEMGAESVTLSNLRDHYGYERPEIRAHSSPGASSPRNPDLAKPESSR